MCQLTGVPYKEYIVVGAGEMKVMTHWKDRTLKFAVVMFRDVGAALWRKPNKNSE
jgi:hypothetical protein